MKSILLIFMIFVIPGIYAQNTSPGLSNSTTTYALIEASRQKMTGNLKEAVSLYEGCIKSDPLCDPAYYELGSIYAFLKENARAENNLSKAFELDPGNYWYGIAYSDLLKINGKYDKALSVLTHMRKQNTSNQLAIDFRISDIYFLSGNYKKTLKKLNTIEKERGVSEVISYKKMDAYRKMNKPGDVEKEMQKLILRAPEYSGYRLVLAEYYLELRDTVKAIRSYEDVYALDTTNIYALTSLAKLHIENNEESKAFKYLIGAFNNDAISLNNKLQTIIAFNSDKSLSPERKKFVEQLVTMLLLKYPENLDVKTAAYDYYNGANNHVIALNLIKQILEKKKDSYIMWQQAIYNASMLENYDEIIDLSDQAVRLFPNVSELYLFSGMAHMQKKEFSIAYEILKTGYKYISSLEQNKTQYYVFLAETAYNSGHKDDAFGYYEEVIKLDPQNDLAKNNYSYFLSLEGKNLERARFLSEQTIMKEPGNSTYLDTYGWILFTMGRYEEAAKYLEKALRLNKEQDAEILFHYAELMNKKQNFADAVIYYNKAREKGFDKEVIKLRIDEISGDR
jgi:tetratricopeptide (TPR) repeat protein